MFSCTCIHVLFCIHGLTKEKGCFGYRSNWEPKSTLWMWSLQISAQYDLNSIAEYFFCKCFQPRKFKQHAKHPVKIHIWEGISTWRATTVIMFSGIMNAQWLATILEASLLPFVTEITYFMIMTPSMPVNTLNIFNVTMSTGGQLLQKAQI